jgi:hypothetical protein
MKRRRKRNSNALDSLVSASTLAVLAITGVLVYEAMQSLSQSPLFQSNFNNQTGGAGTSYEIGAGTSTQPTAAKVAVNQICGTWPFSWLCPAADVPIDTGQ